MVIRHYELVSFALTLIALLVPACKHLPNDSQSAYLSDAAPSEFKIVSFGRIAVVDYPYYLTYFKGDLLTRSCDAPEHDKTKIEKDDLCDDRKDGHTVYKGFYDGLIITPSQLRVDYDSKKINASLWKDNPNVSYFEIIRASEGSMRLRHNKSRTANLKGFSDSDQCVTHGGLKQAVGLAPCDRDNQNQEFIWDSGNEGGYGYIRFKSDHKTTFDIEEGNGMLHGGSDITKNRRILGWHMKPFAAGIGAKSANQRFYFVSEEGYPRKW